MDQQELKAKIGVAWKAHYRGDNEAAIQQFIQLAAEAPDIVDVHWGLGLAYRKAGDLAKALSAFRQAKSLIDQGNSEDPEERGRLTILNRMVNQHIEQLSAQVES